MPLLPHDTDCPCLIRIWAFLRLYGRTVSNFDTDWRQIMENIFCVIFKCLAEKVSSMQRDFVRSISASSRCPVISYLDSNPTQTL